MKKIIHIDMDAFFASVAQLDNPELKGKPVAVGGNKDRGVVAAASYEARKFGVKSAMASVLAHKKCPNLIFVKSDFQRYKEISNQIRVIFSRYTDLIEPLSLDEAYLDVTENKKNMPFAQDIATEICAAIKEEIGLTASAGVSFNKFIAKIASDENKPNGITVISPSMAADFLNKLPIKRFFGVGKVTEKKMYALGIFNGKDLGKCSLEFLVRNFGKSGAYFYQIIRLKDNRAVVPNRIRKSIGIEWTYDENVNSYDETLEKIADLSEKLQARMENSKAKGKTITLKIKYHDFKQITRSTTYKYYINNSDLFFEICKDLLQEKELTNSPIRLLGVSVSNLYSIKDKVSYKQLKFKF